jgi:alpha-tubulin suppressor-like RCC1 family protein
VSIDDYIVDMALGLNHSIILTNKGRVFTAGTNIYADNIGSYRGRQGLGILGESEILDSEKPIEITDKFELLDDEIVVKVFAGYGSHSMSLTNKNRLFGWGRNDNCQITKTNGCHDSAEPIDITIDLGLSTTEKIIDVETSSYSTYVFTSENRLLGWGQIGYYKDYFYFDSPHLMNQYFELKNSQKIIKFEVSNNYGYALIDDGRLYYWGDGNGLYNENKSPTSDNKPIEISSLFNLSQDEAIVDLKTTSYKYYFKTNKGNIYGVGTVKEEPTRVTHSNLPIFLKTISLESEIFVFDNVLELDKNKNLLSIMTSDSNNVIKLLSSLDKTNLKVEKIDYFSSNIFLLNKNTGELFAWGDNLKDQFFGSEKAFKLWELTNLSNLYSEYFSTQQVYQLNYGYPLININQNLFHEINLKNKIDYNHMPAKDLKLYVNNTKKEQP